MTARETFAAWLAACQSCGGASNGLRAPDGTWYYLEARPREQQNGALVGRVFKHVLGKGMEDAGGFKIAADGQVLKVPAALAPQLNSYRLLEEDDESQDGGRDECEAGDGDFGAGGASDVGSG